MIQLASDVLCVVVVALAARYFIRYSAVIAADILVPVCAFFVLLGISRSDGPDATRFALAGLRRAVHDTQAAISAFLVSSPPP
jgi:hypothetical protein